MMPYKNTKNKYYPATLLCLLIVFIQPVTAQYNDQQYKGADGIMHDYIIYDVKGQPVPIGDHSNIGGNPYLQNDWTYGTILLADSSSIKDSMVNYSLYNNHLYFMREKRIFEINYKIKGFTIENRQSGNRKKTFQFRNGFPAIGKNDSTTFYEVLATGASVQLLKWEFKKVIEVYNYGGAYESNYTSVFEYFIYDPSDKKIQSLGNKPNLEKLEKQLPHYKARIDNYCHLNKTDFKKEDSLAAIIASINLPVGNSF